MVRILLFVTALATMAGAAAAFERPVITLHSPRSLEADGMPVRYSSRANVTVMGEIKPPVGDSVNVRVFHVLPDGTVRRLAGATTPVRDGKFNMSIDSPEGGWKEGQLRTEVVLGGLDQVKTSVDVTVLPHDGPVAVGGFRPPEDSGLILDFAKCRGTVSVPANKVFYLRGTFECEGVESKHQGPNVWGSVVREPDGGKGKITYQSSTSLSLREKEGKPLFGYELQIHALKPGIYGLRITPHLGMWLTELDREKPDFMLDVREPKTE